MTRSVDTRDGERFHHMLEQAVREVLGEKDQQCREEHAVTAAEVTANLRGRIWARLAHADAAGVSSAVQAPLREDPMMQHAREYRGPVVHVIDVSHHQGRINWRAVAADPQGVKAAIIRFGDGKDMDSRVLENLHGAREAGLLIGGYRYLRAEHGAELQLELDKRILDTFGQPLDLPLCPDVEGGPGTRARAASGTWQDVRADIPGAPSDEQVIEVTTKYLAGSRRLTGIPPWFYIGRAALDHLQEPEEWKHVPLWLAIGSGGRVPSPWTSVRMYQFSNSHRVAGIGTNVDMNRYFGTLAQLQAEGNARIPVTLDPFGGLLRDLLARW